MSKDKRRRRAKARRQNRRTRQARSDSGSTNLPMAESIQSSDAGTRNVQQAERPSALTIAIRIVGLAPIALLVSFITLNDFLPGQVPSWFQPVIDKEVAVLTLSAGHSGIIGLLISTKGRFSWGTYALFIAAVATAVAGVKTIGESTPGLVIALMLILLTIPAVWAEALSARVQRAYGYVRSLRGLTAILLVSFLVSVAYNQARDENYIRNWILIPFGILLGILVATVVLWLLIKLGSKVIPILFAWLGARVVATYKWMARRRHRR